MLNMNTYASKQWNRFRHGFNMDVGGIGLNRYDSGEIRGRLTFLAITSAGTGHWPFILFDLAFLTGSLFSFHFTLFGLTIGGHMVHNIDEEGGLMGPDFFQMYSFFSCINHQHKTLKEII